MHGLNLGDLALSEQLAPCGECRYCKTGRYANCIVHDVYGFRKHLPGCWAEYMKFPARARNYRVPAEITITQAAVIEPLACSIHAVQRAGIRLGDVVVIAGAGPLGLGMVATARLQNPALLISMDLHDHRLDLAKQLGPISRSIPVRKMQLPKWRNSPMAMDAMCISRPREIGTRSCKASTAYAKVAASSSSALWKAHRR